MGDGNVEAAQKKWTGLHFPMNRAQNSLNARST
jgi:hypothetical protein